HGVIGRLEGEAGVDDVSECVAGELAGVYVKLGQPAGVLDADADGVDLCADGGGDLRGGHGIKLALVVVAVGQGDDDSALGVLETLQTLGGGGDGIADGGSEFADGADVDVVEGVNQPVVIERERAGQVGDAGEDDEADAIVRSAADEVLHHRAGDA